MQLQNYGINRNFPANLSYHNKRLFNNICEITGQKVRDGFISETKEHSGGYVTEPKI